MVSQAMQCHSGTQRSGDASGRGHEGEQHARSALRALLLLSGSHLSSDATLARMSDIDLAYLSDGIARLSRAEIPTHAA